MSKKGGFTFEGLDEYLAQLRQLADVQPIAKKALEEAAVELEAAMHEEIERIPERSARNGKGKLVGLLKSDKDDLLRNLGTTPVKAGRGGEINVKVGFWGGYGRRKTRKWSQGIPVQLTAAALNKGTQWLQAYPFVRRALKRAQARAEQTIKEVFDSEIEKIMKG